MGHVLPFFNPHVAAALPAVEASRPTTPIRIEPFGAIRRTVPVVMTFASSIRVMTRASLTVVRVSREWKQTAPKPCDSRHTRSKTVPCQPGPLISLSHRRGFLFPFRSWQDCREGLSLSLLSTPRSLHNLGPRSGAGRGRLWRDRMPASTRGDGRGCRSHALEEPLLEGAARGCQARVPTPSPRPSPERGARRDQEKSRR